MRDDSFGYDFSLMLQNGKQNSMTILTEPLLVAISVAISSISNMNTNGEYFKELGCYLYRITPAILELQTSQNSPPNAKELLISLTNNVDHANDLIMKQTKGDNSVPYAQDINKVIENMGHDLSLIPLSTFENEQYAATAIQSLSEEMKNVTFQDSFETTNDNTIISYADMPHLKDFLKGMYYDVQNRSYSSNILSQMSENIEPLYDTFFCPLTKKIMHDPVTIESGITYERKAIIEYFDKATTDNMVCPSTQKRIKSRSLNRNIALKMTIDEWKVRNEVTRMKAAHTALRLAKSDAMVLDAIGDLKLLCKKGSPIKLKMHKVGITDLLLKFLKHNDTNLRCQVLDILRLLVEDDEGKEIIRNTNTIPIAINMLSSKEFSVRNASISFLLELSKCSLLCEIIGSATGGILLLITMKYNELSDPIISKKAEEILRNLESCGRNIKCMAENGHLEPLCQHLINGTVEVQGEMVAYLSELVIANDMKTRVAELTSKPLVKMISNGNSPNRKEAFKALVHFSSHHPNNKILIKSGVVSAVILELFEQNKRTNSKEESACILANIVESGLDPNTVEINSKDQTITTDVIIHRIISMIKPSTSDELNMHLIRILLIYTKFEDPFSTILTQLKKAESSFIILNLLNSTHDELVTKSAELLIEISSHMGYTVAERLCKTKGQPEGMIGNLGSGQCITNKHSMTMNLLAKLPHQNLTLNIRLLGSIPAIIGKVNGIQRGEARSSRHTQVYLEGLVGILVRFTATLYDEDILQMARQQNLVSVFTELLIRVAGSAEVQRLCAVGLERLSSQSMNISRSFTERKIPEKRRLSIWRCFSSMARKETKVKLCPVHSEDCSKSINFCLLEAHAVENLSCCLEHENDDVVEAAISAISTLLDESVDVIGSVKVLNEMNIVQQVVKLLRDCRSDTVRRKSLWVIERFLIGGGEKSASMISNDKLLSLALLNALRQGNDSTRKITENILRKLNAVPQYSTTFTV